MATTEWWDAIKLRDEVTNAAGRIDDVQMSLFNAVHGVAANPTEKPPYAAPAYYGEITHPTAELVGFMAQIAVRLGGDPGIYERAKSVWRLDQAMGGGKSHGLIGLWHLATSTPDFASTDLGELVFAEATEIAAGGSVAPNLNRPVCVVLSCDNMTPGVPDPSIDGPAGTLWERFLWRLFETDHAKWDAHRKRLDKDAVSKALHDVGRPVLVLIDEVMDWVQKATAPDSSYEGIVQDMAFMRALLDAANDVPNVSVVVVMIASDKDNITLSDAGEDVRRDLDDLLTRNGHSQAVTSGGDFAEIIRRRLFDAAPAPEVTREVTDDFVGVMSGVWAKEVYDRLAWATATEFRKLVARSYPFHPALIHLAEQEWSQHAGFQKVRSTIQIFAAAAYTQAERAKAGDWSPSLIGPGDLPLSSGDVREALLGSGIVADQRTVAALREIAATEIVNPDDQRGTARQLDLNRDSESGYDKINPRVAERMATALLVYSLAPREQGRRGATEYELKAAGATTSTGFGPGDAELILTQLRSPDDGLAALEELPGKGGQPTRLLLSTRQTLNMFVRALKAAVTDEERDEAIANAAWDLARTGPFKDKLRVQAGSEQDDARPLLEILEEAGIDDARSNRLVVLDPRRFSLLNGTDSETREAVRAAMGLGDQKLAVGWASSAVFACINTQRRSQARGLATEFIARQRALEIDAVRADEELLQEARDRARESRDRFERAAKNAFQHVIYLAEDGDGNRTDQTYRFDKEGQSALDGSVVWAALVEADKAYGEGEFDTKALLHQLRATDWGRPLSEIRDAFWNAPRLPLLPGGDEELRRAIFQAVQAGEARLVDKDGAERKAVTPAEINLGSSGIRLEKPGGGDQEAEVAVPDLVGMTLAAAQAALSAVGLGLKGGGNGVIATQEPAPGTMVATSTNVTVSFKDAADARVEHQLAIAKTTALADAPTRDSLRTLLMALQNAVGDGDASHISLNVQVVVTSDVKDDLTAKAEVAGITPKVTDL